MKTLKWLWWAALIIICIQAVNAVFEAANGAHSFDADSFVGMVLLFAVISGILFVLWTMGRVKEALARKMSNLKSSRQ